MPHENYLRKALILLVGRMPWREFAVTGLPAIWKFFQIVGGNVENL
jgi:hypothetical protein